MQVFNRLQEERKRLGFTQEAFASIAKVAKRTYCNYESGLREPSSGALSLFAAAGADVQYILTGVRSQQMQPSRREAMAMQLFRALSPAKQDEIMAALEEKKLLTELQAQLKAGNG